MDQIRELENLGLTTVYVDFHHLQEFNPDLAGVLLDEFYRMEPYLRLVVRELVKKELPGYYYISQKPQDIAREQVFTGAALAQDNFVAREFQVSFYNIPALCAYVMTALLTVLVSVNSRLKSSAS
jgi:hypothetical protein